MKTNNQSLVLNCIMCSGKLQNLGRIKYMVHTKCTICGADNNSQIAKEVGSVQSIHQQIPPLRKVSGTYSVQIYKKRKNG